MGATGCWVSVLIFLFFFFNCPWTRPSRWYLCTRGFETSPEWDKSLCGYIAAREYGGASPLGTICCISFLLSLSHRCQWAREKLRNTFVSYVRIGNMFTMLDFLCCRVFWVFFFSVLGWLFLAGQVWVGRNACYPLSALGSFILTFQGCLGLSGGVFRVL